MRFSILATAALAAFASLTIAAAASAQTQPLTGQLMLTGCANFCPKGWLPASTWPAVAGINGNQAVFSLYGTSFGGDGRMTFRAAETGRAGGLGMRWCVAMVGTFPPRP